MVISKIMKIQILFFALLIIVFLSTSLFAQSAPTWNYATPVSANQIDLSWNPPPPFNGTVQYYTVYRNIVNNSGTATAIPIPGGTSYNDTGLSPGTIYYYWVKYYYYGFPSGFSPLSIVISALTYPQSPSWISATPSANQISLAWNAVQSASSYIVYRNTVNNSGTASAIATISGTSYNDMGLLSYTTYYYWLKANNSSGSSVYSSVNSALTLPQQPQWLSAIPVSTYQINLVWHNLPFISSYTLFRNTANNTNTVVRVTRHD